MAQGASDGGYVYSGSLRSPIFYDSDDTSYYVNPNSVTRLYSTSVYAGNEASNTGANGSTEGFILRGNYNSNTWAKKFHNYDNGSGIQLYLAETIGASAWSTIQGWGTGLGYTSRVFGSFRANETYGTIFYDADNTAYYINPTGSSQVSGSNFYFGSKGQIYDDGNFHIDGRNSPVWINSLSSEAIFLNSQTSGYTVMGNSARSPIFYDSNDTGYYLDPNSSGVALRISGAIRGDHVGWTGEHNKIQWHSSHMYFQNMNDGYWIFRKSNATEPFLLHADGWGQASGSWRAPIFYDSNDTGFYLDPQGGSRLNALSLNSVSITAGVTSLTNAPIVTQQVQVGTTNTWLPMTYQRALHNAGYITHLNTGLYKSASGWGDNVTGWYAALGGSDSSPTMEWRLTYGTYIYNSNGYVSTSGSFRSSLFYDHDDTAYYCNPNSFSQLSYANLNAAPGGRTLSLGGDETNRVYNDSARAGLVINATYYPHLYINATANNGNTSHGAVFSMTGNLSGGGYRRWGMGIANTNPDCWSWGYYDNEPNPHYGVGGGFGYTGTNSKMWLNTGGSLWTTGDMRTPIFYDSDNTGYYVNPTGGSNLNGTLVNNGGTGMTAGWNRNLLLSSTYPVLVWNSSSASYSGIGVDHSGADSRFIFWINGTSEDVTGTGTIAMRMSSGNFVTATGSFRAPIFYDSNDTTYYVDPASFTYLYGGIQNNGAHGSSTIDNRMLAGNNGAGTGVVQLRMWCSEPGVTWDWAGFGYNVLNDGGSPGGFGRVNSSFGQAYMRFGTSGDLLFYNVTTGAARYTTMQLHSTGYVTAFQSSRAPIFYDSDDTTYYADLNSTGTSIRAAGNITAYYSDMRLKTHLGKIENARDKVRQLEGFYYEANELAQSFGYKAKREVGVSAQAVQAVLPEIVTDAPINSNYLTIDYERLTPLLIEAIKEQDTELVDLRNRVAQLESLINKLIGD
jgi:hypothetical protein